MTVKTKKNLVSIGAAGAVAVALGIGMTAPSHAQTAGVSQATEVSARGTDKVLVDITPIARDLDKRLALQGQAPGIVWLPSSAAAQVCNVSTSDLAPPEPGRASVCLASRSSVALDTAVQRDLSDIVE